MIRKWITKKRKWSFEKKRIRRLRESLFNLGTFPADCEGAFNYAVKFLQVIANFQDDGGIWHAPERLLKFQAELSECINQVGRNRYGINRTKKKEKVTMENTYWGANLVDNIQTAKNWLEDKSTYPNFSKKFLKMPERYEDNPPCVKVVLDFQVRPLVLNNMSKILEICDKLLGIKRGSLRK